MGGEGSMYVPGSPGWHYPSLHIQLFHTQADAFPISAETGPSASNLLCPQAAHPQGLAPQSTWLCIWLKLCSPFILPSSFTVLVCSQPAFPTWQLTAAIKSCRGRCFPSKGTQCFPCWTWDRFPLRELICAAKLMQLEYCPCDLAS